MANITNFNQQLQDYKNQLTAFKNKEAADEKLENLKLKTKDEQNKEKTEAAKAQGKGSKPLPSGERAIVAALAIAMQANMDRMGSSANSMQNEETTIDAQMAKLNALNQENSAISGLSPQDAMEKGLEVTCQITAANNENSTLETSLNMDGAQLSFASNMNNTVGGAAQWIIGFLEKEETRA